MMSLPHEVLLQISKWLSLEERMTHLAPVCRYLYDVSVVKSSPDIKIFDAGGCETISVNQALGIFFCP